MRALARITLTALVALLFASAVSAQTGDAWVEVAPEGESFVARMPAQPVSQSARVEAGELKVAGHRYAAMGDDKSTYAVWSLDDPNNVGKRLSGENYVSALFRGGEALYLDRIAEVAWELFLTPEMERLKNEQTKVLRNIGMSYEREFELGGHPARSYFVQLEKVGGLVYVVADGPRIYIVAALGTPAQADQLKQFVESFGFKATPPAAPSTGPGTGAGRGSGIGPGRGNIGSVVPEGGTVDYTRPFIQKDVTQKALITFKPEPGFTEEARRFSVTGVVRLRGILNRTGEVTNLVVIKGLPHGLTTKSLDAARRVRFTPAQKDGHVVSQYIVFEYNFNIY